MVCDGRFQVETLGLAAARVVRGGPGQHNVWMFVSWWGKIDGILSSFPEVTEDNQLLRMHSMAKELECCPNRVKVRCVMMLELSRRTRRVDVLENE